MNKKWKDVKISYGSAAELPALLRLMCSQNEEEREKSYWQVQNAVVLQSDLYEGAYYVIEPLLEMLENSACYDKYRPLDILHEIFNGYAEFDNIILNEEGRMVHLAEACRSKISKNKSRIQHIEVALDNELEIKDDLLDSIENPPPLFPSEDEMQALIAELERLRKLL